MNTQPSTNDTQTPARVGSADGSAILEAIKEHNLMVRPSFTGGWRAGVWKGATLDAMPKAYCVDATEWEASDIETAVALCVMALKTGQRNPDFDRMQAALTQNDGDQQ